MKRYVLVGLLAAAIPFLSHAQGPSLLDAIRAGDKSAIEKLPKGSPALNLRDDAGATPLMYAAIYGTVDDMRTLLDRGADVNAASATGATALMWAADDTAKVRLLLERGASATAKATNGTTALVVAARRENPDTMRLLIAAGIDAKAASGTLFPIAYAAEKPAVREVLAAAGVDLKDPALLTSQLAVADNMINVGLTERLVAAGGVPDPDVRVATLTASAMAFAASAGNISSVRTLIARGADANKRGSRGLTPLMMAAAAPRPDPAMVRLLLDSGANLGDRDDAGRTALDWALLQGDTAVARALRASGATAMAPPAPAPTAVASPRSARAAVEKAIGQLQTASPGFVKGARCISCHNESLPAMAMTVAAAKGVQIDPVLLRHPNEATLATWTPPREEMLLGRSAIAGFVGHVTYGLLSLAEEGIKPSRITDAVTLQLATTQRTDGSWIIGDVRPPLFDPSAIHSTALAIRGLDVYMPAGRRADAVARIARARDFLRTATPANTQDEACKLMGLVWAHTSAAEIAAQASRLRALQRADGGWSQLPTMASDAYQSGQALYALHVAGMTPADAVYQKGTQFLLRTQLEDGTWFVRSRAIGFQPYFDTGFPHGTDQFISAAATSWATLALAYTM